MLKCCSISSSIEDSHSSTKSRNNNPGSCKSGSHSIFIVRTNSFRFTCWTVSSSATVEEMHSIPPLHVLILKPPNPLYKLKGDGAYTIQSEFKSKRNRARVITSQNETSSETPPVTTFAHPCIDSPSQTYIGTIFIQPNIHTTTRTPTHPTTHTHSPTHSHTHTSFSARNCNF